MRLPLVLTTSESIKYGKEDDEIRQGVYSHGDEICDRLCKSPHTYYWMTPNTSLPHLLLPYRVYAIYPNLISFRWNLAGNYCDRNDVEVVCGSYDYGIEGVVFQLLIFQVQSMQPRGAEVKTIKGRQKYDDGICGRLSRLRSQHFSITLDLLGLGYAGLRLPTEALILLTFG